MITCKHYLRAILVLAIVCFASFAYANNTVSLNIKDMPVREVITNLMSQSDVNIIMTDDARMDKRIRINLNNYDIDKALNAIMAASGLSFKKIDDNTYIIGGASAVESNGSVFNPESLLSNISGTDTVSTETYSAPVDNEKEVFKVIELTHVGATELLKTLGYYNSSFAGYNNIPSYKTHNARIKYQDDGQISVPSVNPMINDGSGRTAEIANLSGARNNSGNNSSSGSGRGNRSGNNNSGNNNSNSNSGSNGSSGGFGGSKSFLTKYDDDDNKISALIPYDLNNSIMVRGKSDEISEFEKEIKEFDIPPRQVEIKCEFITISTSETKRFGIDWAIGKAGRAFYTTFNPAGNVWFDFANGNLEATVAAELTNGIGKLVNAPIISTLNNIEGSISVTRTVPRFSSQVSGDGVNPVATYSSSDIDITSDLYVTPRINRDNSITMIIEASIGDDLGEVESPDKKSSSHETIDQEIETIRRVYDGETVVIGGFVRQNDQHDINKIPLLSDLPIVGNLFKTTSIEKTEEELLIFVTPRIIHDSINMNNLIN